MEPHFAYNAKCSSTRTMNLSLILEAFNERLMMIKNHVDCIEVNFRLIGFDNKLFNQFSNCSYIINWLFVTQMSIRTTFMQRSCICIVECHSSCGI